MSHIVLNGSIVGNVICDAPSTSDASPTITNKRFISQRFHILPGHTDYAQLAHADHTLTILPSLNERIR
jgi:hypothetical protein